MATQFVHDVLPRADHDESARQNFAVALKQHISADITAGNRTIVDRRVLPTFTRQHRRDPRNRKELKGLMDRDAYCQMWGSLTRLSQELMWDSVEESVARQLDGLVERARTNGRSLGSLRLDPDLQVPRYMSAVDIHAMPGGYASEVITDDVRAGALFDRGTFLNVCGTQGALHDARGKTAVAFLKTEYPDFAPRRILDMGCSVGQATLPFATYYPDAEVHAIDVAAPLLRYAHGRAESLSTAVHFSQQNAESTDYDAASFDLIVSHLLFHETSTKAMPRILAECHRLLRPGGRMVHLELGLPYKDMDLFEQVIHDWQTYNNAEPFWTKINTTDTAALARDAGFGEARAGYVRKADNPLSDQRRLGGKEDAGSAHIHPQGDRGDAEFYWVMTGVK